MIPGRVIGRLVAAQGLAAFQGVKFLLVQPTDGMGNDDGLAVIACDAVGANLDEEVFMAQGLEATFALPVQFNPADLTIVAIIDQVTT